MAINADKPHLWKQDIALSVDMFNQWFTLFAPKTYRDSRATITSRVEDGIRLVTKAKPPADPCRSQIGGRLHQHEQAAERRSH